MQSMQAQCNARFGTSAALPRRARCAPASTFLAMAMRALDVKPPCSDPSLPSLRPEDARLLLLL